MTSLYKRATPRQAMVLRMVAGAVKNAAHAHPGQPLNDKMARSIAKRAAGTITSQWKHIHELDTSSDDEDVLATPQAWSEDVVGIVRPSHVNGTGQVVSSIVRSVETPGLSRRRPASHEPWRGPLHLLKKNLGAEVGRCRRNHDMERAAALIDVLRLLDRMISADKPPKYGELLILGKLP